MTSEKTGASLVSEELLVIWHDNAVCELRLNRPKAYNALSKELVDCLRHELQTLSNQKARVLLITASTPGFCAGADLKQRKVMSDQQKYDHNRSINALANEIADLPIPTIAVINGVAMGGGCELTLACDIRFASTDAIIGLTESRIGAMPGAGGSQRLPRLIPTGIALEMMFSGEPISAKRAVEVGLVNQTYDADDLYHKVLTFATLLSTRSCASNALLKKTVYEGLNTTLSNGLELERIAIEHVIASDDYKEGLTAFAKKSTPSFS
jgi:enoyl-CoA hydratase/carnithine racemase